MPSKLAHDLEDASYFSDNRADSPRGFQQLYLDLCKIENLQLVYTQLKESHPNSVLDKKSFTKVGQDEAQILRQLSNDLQSRTYHPGSYSLSTCDQKDSDEFNLILPRDRLVEVLLKSLLDPLFQPDLPCDPEPEKAIEWLTGVVENGLTRVYAVNLED